MRPAIHRTETASKTGRCLVLLHGWGFAASVWEETLLQLARYAENKTGDVPFQKIYRVDFPGYGASPFAPTSPPALAEALLDALPEGALWCGWSLGAQIALQAALSRPEHLVGLALVGATPCFVRREAWPHAQPEAVFTAFAEAVAHDSEAALTRFAALVNQRDARLRQTRQTLIAAREITPPPDPRGLAEGLDWLRQTDLRAALAGTRISLPTLLIHGERDALAPVAASEWLAQHLPQAALEVFPETAHAPFLSQPEKFAARLAAFDASIATPQTRGRR
ncbi:MAG: alpha/beta fold hydrolase [Betaproteobacteria bacterium]|nr:alpha/beta fold hydrolase [Betaproteobacteria bacterium]